MVDPRVDTYVQSMHGMMVLYGEKVAISVSGEYQRMASRVRCLVLLANKRLIFIVIVL